jgi:hypothetical protein
MLSGASSQTAQDSDGNGGEKFLQSQRRASPSNDFILAKSLPIIENARQKSILGGRGFLVPLCAYARAPVC